jgi:ApeA N-terminal domain 1
VNSLTKHAIPDSFQLSGEWFLPDNENDKKIGGVLFWISDRARLELHDSFSSLKSGDIYVDIAKKYDEVHGITTDHQLITVLDAVCFGSSFHFGSSTFSRPEKLISSCLIIGDHVRSETLYNEIRVRIPGLHLWIGRSGLSTSFHSKTEQLPHFMNIVVTPLSEEIFEIPNISASLGFEIEPNTSGDLISEITVKTSAFLRIKPDTARNLLSFLAGSPMSTDQITAEAAISGKAVEIFVALRESNYCRHKAPYEFFIQRRNMGIELNVVFSKWFEIYENIAMPSQLALSVLCSNDLWSHVEFLTLMQALEGFHRATTNSMYTSEKDYESIRQTITNAIPQGVTSDHKDALKSRIKYGNEVSLRKRLDLLVECLPLPLRKLILNGNGTVPRSWVITRNYYTHWDEASRPDILGGLEMHQAAVRMRLLLRVLYLNHVGIPDTVIAKSLQNECHESQYLIQLNNKQHRDRTAGSNAGAIMHISLGSPENLK